MKRNFVALTVLAAAISIFMLSSCQEAAKVQPASKAAPKTDAVKSPAAGQKSMTAQKPADAAASAERKSAPAQKPADASAAAEQKPSGPAPKIEFEKITHNFNDVSPSSENVCEFKFKNTGKGLLKITDVSKSCGCTPFTLDKIEYAAGETGQLKVKYNAGTYPGPVTRNLFVSSNDLTNPKVTLTIQANIAPKVKYEPERISLMLNKENAGCPDITLTGMDGQPFAIKQFKSSAEGITADYDPNAQATKFVLKPKIDIEKVRKALNGHIEILLTHPKCDKVTIFYNAVPRFELKPPSLVVYKVEPLKPVTKELWLLNNYEESFEVESTASRDGIVKLVGQEKVGNRYKFILEVTPPVIKEGARVFTDIFTINIKGGEQLQVNCNGFYAKEAVDLNRSGQASETGQQKTEQK